MRPGFGFQAAYTSVMKWTVVFASAVLAGCALVAAESPPPAVDSTPGGAGRTEVAVLAGGCFWGVEAVFEQVKGVKDVVSGYAGGSKRDADYETVSGGRTGHAESVRITFDPAQV